MRLSPSIVRVPLLAGALVFAVAAPASAADLPVITSVTPGYGPVAGGNTITVNGTGLTGAYFVSFDLSDGRGVGATILSNTATSIEVVVPAGALGKSNIYLGNEGGRSADSPADDYIFTADGSEPTATPTPTPEATLEPTPVVTPGPGATPTPTPSPTPIVVTPVATPTPTPKPGGDTTFVNYPFNLSGTASLKTLTKGTLPLTGTINARLGLPSQTFTAALALNPSAGKLTALGFLPVDAKVNLESTEPVQGSLIDSVLIANAKVRIKLPSVKTLGIELAGGANCQAKQISAIQLKSTQEEFLPTEGGPIAGTFSISDLTGCGFLTGIVSPITKGSGNAIALNLINQ